MKIRSKVTNRITELEYSKKSLENKLTAMIKDGVRPDLKMLSKWKIIDEQLKILYWVVA